MLACCRATWVALNAKSAVDIWAPILPSMPVS